MSSANLTDRIAPPSCRRGGCTAARFSASLPFFLAVGALLFAQSGGDDESLSIQRLIIPPARLAHELEKVQQGTLILVPLPEFDANVERARQALKARSQKPHLTRTHYSAELADRWLTNGSGQWTVQYAGAAPAVLSIEPLNVALTRLQWQAGGEAVLAEFAPKALGLLVPPGENSTCLFDWSARGTPTNDGLVFNLLVPPCPIVTFELKVPADYWLSATKPGVVVTGPHETGSAGLRLWKLQVTGTPQLEINLRKIAEPKGPGPTIFSRVHSVQQLAANRVAIEHEFQIDVLHGSLRELVLLGNADLEPLEVSLKTGGDVKSWQWKELPAKKDAKAKDPPMPMGALTIQFRQPVQGKMQSLRVRSIAERPSGSIWTCPALRVQGALSRGETLALHLPADLPLGKWSPGSFQLTSLLTESDGAQVLALADTALLPAASRRPTLMLPLKAIDVATTEAYHWHITPRRADLKAEIQFAATRGNLLELPIKLPAGSGYQVESLELSPPDLLRAWQPSGDFVVVELKQPLTPGKKVLVKLQLRALFQDIVTSSRDLTFPALQLIDGVKREGSLIITLDPSLQGQMLDASAPLASAFGPAELTPSWHLTFRGQGLKAKMRVAPAPVHVKMRGKHAVTLSELETALQFRWEAEPLAGAPEFLDFNMAPEFPAAWKIKAEEGDLRIHHWERFGIRQPGAAQALAGAVLQPALPGGTHWRFHLAEPLRKKGSFTLEASVPGGKTEQAWRRFSIPLMIPVQNAGLEQEMLVDSMQEPIDKFAGVGPLVVRPATGTGKASLQLQLQQKSGPASILLWTHPHKRAASPAERCDEAGVTTFVRRDGSVWQRIAFRLWHWRDRTLDLQFPPGSTVVAVTLNDRWLERQDLRVGRDGQRLTLPFDQNVDVVRYEIYVRLEPAEWGPGLLRLEPSEFAWPAAPLDVQRRVCLENGWMPLHQEALSLIGVPAAIADQSAAMRWPGRLWNLAESWLPFGSQGNRIDLLSGQRSVVLLAEKQLRDAGDGKAIKLGAALEQFALKHLKDTPLVLDRVAMNSLGLTAETMIPAPAMSPQARPFWESLGLVYEPYRSGALLTTPRRLNRLGIASPGQAGVLDLAIKEAIRHGRDASGGLLLVPDWLRLPPGDASFFSGMPFSNAEHGSEFPEITEWDVLPDSGDAGVIYVFDPQVARILSVLLAVFATLLFWKIQRVTTAIVCFRAHVLMLVGGVLAVLWWPASFREFVALPILAVLIVSMLVCLIRVLRMKDGNARMAGSTIVKPLTKTVGLSLLLLGFTWALSAQPTPPRGYSVFIIEGKKPAVLVPPELIARLDKLQKEPTGAPGAAIVQAKYMGKVKEGLARFEVEYQIHSGRDANLMIPLTGVQLQEGAFLDGAPVFPAPHKSGYVVPIKGSGAHQLRLSFAVRVGSANDQFDLKFTIPKVVQTSVQVEWSAPVQGLSCQHCWGEERRSVDGRQAVKEWHAQLGGENVAQLRWTNLGTLPMPKIIEVTEAHFWDLRPGASALSSVLRYAVGAGTLTQINIGLPEALQVRGVEAMAVLPAPGVPLLIKNWQVLGKGAQRRLTVELAQPANGMIAVNLDIVPQLALRERKLHLPLPAPLQGKSVAGLLGYRLDADENPSAQDLAVQSITPEEFEPLWKKAGGPAVASASRAYRFQRKSAQAALEIDQRGDSRQAQFHLQWGLDLHHADLVGRCQFRSAREDLMLLEFFVDPALTLTDVAGVDVKRWHLQDSLLQVWLRQPRRETTVDLLGWRSLPFKNEPAAKRTMALPRVQPLGVQISEADLELRPAPGIQVEQELVRRLRAPYDVAVGMRTETKPPLAGMLTKVEGTSQGVAIEHCIFVPTEQGRLPGLKVEVKDWHGEPPMLDAPGAKVVRIVDPQRGRLGWAIQYPSGLPGTVVVKVRGRIDKDVQGRLVVPAFEMDGARIVHSWAAWKDVELQSAGKKLANQRGMKETILKSADADWLRDSHAWQCAEAVGPLQAALPNAQPRTSVRVLTAAETIRRADGRWLHEASFWVHAPESAELRFRFPVEITAVSALTDHRLQAGGSGSARFFTLPLNGSVRPRFVQLSWHEADAAQSPNLTAIQLEQAVLPRPARVLWIPAGMSATKQPTPTLFERLVQEADDHAQVAAALAEEPARSADAVKEIAARQQQFFACVREAEYALGIAKSLQREFDAAGALERLSDLKRKNAALAKEHRFDEQRVNAQKAKKTVWTAQAVPLGTPVLLFVDSSNLVLQDESEQFTAERGTRSELILLAAVFLLVFSYFRHSFSLARRFAPEIGIGLCVSAMLTFGVSMIGVALIGMMFLVRLWWIASALGSRFIARPMPEPPSSPPPA